MSETPLVSIIIVTYKALNYVKACLESIQENTPHIPYEIIVIDNDSGPIVVDYLLREQDVKWPQFRVIYNTDNKLLTPAQNQGIRAMHPESKYALFIMPDSIVLRNDWLELLLNELEKDFVGITGPVCNYFPTKPMYGELDMSCLLVTKQVLDKVGGLNEKYPMDGGGLALCLAAYSNRILFSHLRRPKIVKHFGGKSREQNPMLRQKIDRRDVYWEYGIKPRFSLWGLIQQIIMRPETMKRELMKRMVWRGK